MSNLKREFSLGCSDDFTTFPNNRSSSPALTELRSDEYNDNLYILYRTR